ncbi:T9SS type A sorting domain-containing protein [Panacibacter ginsenosidivorans]|nr:T9SS type A sorting domain-containing protein [Panacibacter ginsenosidivorans]
MKKTLLIVVLLVSTHQLFAFSTQGKWRWRKDDGTEKTATWIAAENTAITINNTNDLLRLRISLYNDPANPGGFLDGAQLQDSSDLPGAKWDTVRTTARNNPFMFAGTSPNLTDLEKTTNQMTGEGSGLTFTRGRVLVSTEFFPSFTINEGEQTEYEFCIKATSNIQAGTTYYFRVAAAEYPAGLVFPTLSTAEVLPIHLNNFKVEADNNHVKVTWTTTSEINNDHFEVERSTDAINWKTVATIKGSGTSSIAHSYSALDVSPVKGNNYYRIKQYDLNGKSFISDVRSIKMFVDNSLLTVYPNPAKAVINFILRDYTGNNIVATLTNNSGRIIHQENIKAVQANVKYALNMKQQPAPGIYILQLKGEGLSESIRVVVQ